jgi:hypothetical protein
MRVTARIHAPQFHELTTSVVRRCENSATMPAILAAPEEGAAVFLRSDAARFSVAAAAPVDGGCMVT